MGFLLSFLSTLIFSSSPPSDDDDDAGGLGVTRYCCNSSGGGISSSAAAVECVFCLCGVEEGEEVRELRCRHLFHRRCPDRWLAHPRATCPLCRDALLLPHRAAAEKGDDDEEEEEEELAVVLLGTYLPWWML